MLGTLVRLWLLQSGVSAEAAHRSLPGLVEPLCAGGLLELSGDRVAALVDLRPSAQDGRDLWVVSDRRPGLDGAPVAVGADHVLGVSSASSSLARLTVRRPAARALDLGTGCGGQSLHLASHVDQVVATDVNPRAVAMTGLNAQLNDVPLDVRHGSLFAPVEDETFDLIVSNPPFVVSSATEEQLVYRDSGLPGDEMIRRVLQGAATRLAPGGLAQVLGNWVHRRGESWQERVGGWFEDLGCDVWVVQREVADPAEYVELWLKDAGVHGTADYLRRYDTWLAWFDEQAIEGVGFGWVNLARVEPGHAPSLRLEEWAWEVEQPLGPEIGRWQQVTAALSGPLATTDGVLAARPVTRADVRQDTHGPVGEPDPETIVLRQGRGLRRARSVDTVLAGLVGACDGELSVGQIQDAVAQLTGADPAAVRAEQVPAVRELVAEGYLEV